MKSITVLSSIILFIYITGCSKSVELSNDDDVINYTGTITETYLSNQTVYIKGIKKYFSYQIYRNHLKMKD